MYTIQSLHHTSDTLLDIRPRSIDNFCFWTPTTQCFWCSPRQGLRTESSKLEITEVMFGAFLKTVEYSVEALAKTSNNSFVFLPVYLISFVIFSV